MPTIEISSKIAKNIVAVNLRRHRSVLGISQEKLALDADVDRTYVSQLEKRAIANPFL